MTKKHQPNIKAYMIVFGTLMFLTVVTVAVSYLDLAPGPAVALGLLIASVKAGLVAAYFMHLKGEQALILFFLGLTVVALAILFIIPITDMTGTKHKVVHGESAAAAEAQH